MPKQGVRNTKAVFDTAWVFGINGIQICILALTYILLANSLGPAGYGLFSFAITAGSLAVLVSGVGGDQVLIMFGSRQEARLPVLLGNACAVRGGISLVCAGIFYPIAQAWWSTESEVTAFVLVSIATLVQGFLQPLFMSYYRVVGIMRWPWGVSLLGRMGFLALLYIVPSAHGNLVSVSMGYFGIQIAMFLFFITDILRRVRLRVSAKALREDIRAANIFWWSQILDLVSLRLDVFFLKPIGGDYALGLYNSVNRMLSVLMVFPSALHIVFQPQFHRIAQQGEMLTVLFLRARRMLIEAGCFVLGFTAASGACIVGVFLSNEYRPAIQLIPILSLYVFFNFMGYPYAMLAEAQGKLMSRLIMRLSTVIFSIPVMWISVTYCGALGCACTMALSMGIFFALLHLLTSDLNAGLKSLVFDLAPILASVAGMLALFLLNPLLPHTFLGLICRGILFSAVFIFFGWICCLLKYMTPNYIRGAYVSWRVSRELV